MAERPEDLNLPNTVVGRIIKDALPVGVNVGKDARLAIGKAASVFVLYATSCANNNALGAKRKTINVNDVFNALEDMEFDSFLDPLKADLEAYKKSQANKKGKKAKRPKAKENSEVGDDESADQNQEDIENQGLSKNNKDNETDHEETPQMDTSS